MPKRPDWPVKKWKPGQTGNPNGRPKLTLEQREWRQASKQMLLDEFKYLWAMSESELEQISAHDNDQPMIRKMLARQMLSGSTEEVLNRVIGKPKEEIDLNNRGSIHFQLTKLIEEIENGDSPQIEGAYDYKGNEKEAKKDKEKS